MSDLAFPRRARIRSAIVVALISTGLQYAHAEESPQGLQMIIVTAQKVRQNINAVGMSIAALTGSQLRETGVSSPDQLAKDVVGFNYTRSSYGTPIFTLRGIGFYDTVPGASPTVSVYLDQMPLPYPAMTPGLMLDARRVEVLKGPQGTLFGQNATGGAINVVPNAPTDTFETGVDVSYTNYGELNADGFLSGPLGATVGLRLAASTDHGGAWQKSDTRNAVLGAKRLDVGRMLLDWKPARDLQVEFNINGWVDRSDEQAGQIAGLVSAKPPPALVAAFDSYPVPSNPRQADWDPGAAVGKCDPIHRVCHDGFTHDDHFAQAAMRADYSLGARTTLTSITAYEHLNQSDFLDTDGMDINNYNVSTGADMNSLSEELRLEGQTARLQWLFGGNYANDRVFNWGDVFTSVGTFPFPSAGSIATMGTKTYAAFAHGEYSLTHTLSVVAGVRYTKVRIHNAGCTLDGGNGILAAVATHVAAAFGSKITIPAGSCVTLNTTTFQPGLIVDQLNQSNVPFTTGLNWKVAPDSLLYLSIGRGYKAGDFSPVGAIFSSSLAPATQESVLAYEGGFKLRLADNRLQLNGAAFYYDYTNKQVQGEITDPVVGLLKKLINIPKSRIDGGELGATWAPDEHWIVNAGASYTDSAILGNYTNFTVTGQTKDMEGERLPLTPKLQWLGDAEYDFGFNENTSGFVGAHVNYQGSSNSGLGDQSLFKIDAFADLDLRLGVRASDDRWSAMLFVNNATDKYSWNFVALGGPDSAMRYANLPRVFGIRLSVRN